MKQMEEFCERMQQIRTRLDQIQSDPLAKDERANLKRELRDLMVITQEFTCSCLEQTAYL